MSEPADQNGIELPRSTAAPLVLATGVLLVFGGVVFSLAMSAVGLLLVLAGLSQWIGQFSAKGHELAAKSPPPAGVAATIGQVEQLFEGRPGYRMRLPIEVHPISAGIKGGIVGGLLMPLPALLWGHLSGHGMWFPVNLLAGMVVPGFDELPVTELEKFRMTWLLTAIVIHAVMSFVLGLIYGVLLPTLPPIRGGQLIYGGVLLPLLWTGASYSVMGVVNPALQQQVHWPWFIASQFVFGIAAAIVVVQSEKVATEPAGIGPEPEISRRINPR